MTDKELLELAAKAAGIDLQFRVLLWSDGSEYPCYEDKESVSECGRVDVVIRWNPLENPGDALRLAVALHIELKFQAPDYRPYWTVLASERGDWAAATETGPDTLAATMRAIVRVAAEIGRAKT